MFITLIFRLKMTIKKDRKANKNNAYLAISNNVANMQHVQKLLVLHNFLNFFSVIYSVTFTPIHMNK